MLLYKHLPKLWLVLLLPLCYYRLAEAAAGAAEVTEEGNNGSSTSHVDTDIGVSMSGTWKELPYEIIYYVSFEEKTGPLKKVQCLDRIIGEFFSSPSDVTLPRLTVEQQERVKYDANRVKEMKKIEDNDRTYRLDERLKGITEDGVKMYGPIPRIGDRYYGGAHHPPQEARAGLAYTFDIILAVYLNGTYIDTYKTDETVLSVSTPVEFEAFVKDTLTSNSIQSDSSVDIMKNTQRCIQDLGSDIWDPSDNEMFQNTPIIGRQISGIWEDKDTKHQKHFEIISFLEFFRISPRFYGKSKTTKCFFDTVESSFFVPANNVMNDGDATDEQPFTISELSPEQVNDLRSISWDEEGRMKDDDSIFWKYSLGSSGCSGFSVQHGVTITLDGQVIRSRRDLPKGFEAKVSSYLEKLVASPFELQDSMDETYEYDINYLRDDNYALIMVLASWLDNTCLGNGIWGQD